MQFVIIVHILKVLLSLQNQVLLTAAENRLVEARKQYDIMLENKQLELSRHLKDLSLRNDQVLPLTTLYEMSEICTSTFRLTKEYILLGNYGHLEEV